METRSAGKGNDEIRSTSSQPRATGDDATTSGVQLPELSNLRVCDTPNPDDRISSNAVHTQQAHGQEGIVNQPTLAPVVRIMVAEIPPAMGATGVQFQPMDFYVSPNASFLDIPTDGTSVSLSAVSTPSMARCSPRTLPFIFPGSGSSSGTVSSMPADVSNASNVTSSGSAATRPTDNVPSPHESSTVSSTSDKRPSCSSWTEDKMEDYYSEADTVNDYSDDSCMSPNAVAERHNGGGKSDRCPLAKRKTRPIQETNDPMLAKKRADNRVAAQKCRDNKKNKMEGLKQELTNLREGKGRMQKQIDDLKAKVSTLEHQNAILETRANQPPMIFAVTSADFGLQTIGQMRPANEGRLTTVAPSQLPFCIPLQQLPISNLANESITAQQPVENAEPNSVHGQSSQQPSVFSTSQNSQFDPTQSATSCVTEMPFDQAPLHFSVQPPPPYPASSTAYQNWPAAAPWMHSGSHQQIPRPAQMHQLPRLLLRGADNSHQQIYSEVHRGQPPRQQQCVAVPETGQGLGSTEQQPGVALAFSGNLQPVVRAPQQTHGGQMQERLLVPPGSQMVQPNHGTGQTAMNRHPVPYQTGYQTSAVHNPGSAPTQNQMAQPSSQLEYGTERDAGASGSSHRNWRRPDTRS